MKDLTTGSPLKRILLFCLPILMGTLFQQFYNLADSVIVGRFLGVNAFAAVGCTGSLNFMIIGFALGMCSGCAIPVARAFGAGSMEDVRKYTAQIVHIGITAALAIMVLTFFLTKPLLRLLNTPPEIFDSAARYISIIFMGVSATILYNMACGLLRAIGNSRAPTIFLVISVLTNIVLDLLFIAALHMGVGGAAAATIISQLLSGVLCLLYIRQKMPVLHFGLSDLRYDFSRIAELVRTGLPMGLQFSITAIGALVVQGAVNSLGSDIVASIAASRKINNLLMSPFEAIGATMATYCGQNIGARKIDRVRQGVRSAVGIMLIYSAIGFLIAFFFAKPISSLFLTTDDAEIIRHMHISASFTCAGFPLLTIIQVFRNSLQGLGVNAGAAMAGVAELVGRFVSAYLLLDTLGFYAVCFAAPLSWVLADILLLSLYFIRIRKEQASEPQPIIQQ